RDVLVVAIARGREGEIVKQGERLRQKRRMLRGADPGPQVVQEALQRVLVRLDGRAVQGALEQRGDKLHNECVVGGRRMSHRGLAVSVMVASRGYNTPRAGTHGLGTLPPWCRVWAPHLPGPHQREPPSLARLCPRPAAFSPPAGVVYCPRVVGGPRQPLVPASPGGGNSYAP